MTSLIYNTGTVSVSAGSAVVSGSLTGWEVALVTGGLFSCVGVSIPIVSVESDTSLTLAYPWPGATAAGKAYAIARDTSEATRAAWTNDRLATIIQRLSLVGIHPDGSGTLAERDALDPVPATGYIWLYLEAGHDPLFYRKSDSGWEGPFDARGEAGPQGPIGPAGDGFNPAGAWSIGTTYAKNDMVSHGGRTFVSFASGNVGHEPPAADEDDTYWQFVPAAVGPEGPKGDKGDTGDTGPAGTITSATATGLAAGAAPTVTLGGTASARTFAFGIPKGDKGDTGSTGNTGNPGADGDDGWTPVLAVVADGARYVQQVVDWTGGTGTKPAAGKYVGPTGLVALVGDAVNIRGASGSGTGDMLKATYDPNNKAGDAFAMDNMVEGTSTKIMTAAERTKLGGIATGATANTGTVTSVGVAVPTGLSATGAITTSGTITISYAAGYQGYTTAEANKLAGIATGAQVNAVTSVAGKTGAVTLAKGDVGLGSVDNTADDDKPVSVAQAAAIAGKVDKAVDTALAAGYTAASVDDGTKSSGTYTPSPAGGNYRKIINGGAFTLAAPTDPETFDLSILITNNASAGAITFTGFPKAPTGAPLTTIDGDKFLLRICVYDGAVVYCGIGAAQ